MWQIIRFSDVEARVPREPGIYEIHTDSGIALKVGIGGEIRKRLLQHRNSKQRCLELTVGGDRSNPSHVKSKQSILAKHLYYDGEITSEYDLTSEAGRTKFLCDCCYIKFKVASSNADAKKLERISELTGLFRYVGTVVIRKRKGRE
jgi:hypothetical protein